MVPCLVNIVDAMEQLGAHQYVVYPLEHLCRHSGAEQLQNAPCELYHKSIDQSYATPTFNPLATFTPPKILCCIDIAMGLVYGSISTG